MRSLPLNLLAWSLFCATLLQFGCSDEVPEPVPDDRTPAAGTDERGTIDPDTIAEGPAPEAVALDPFEELSMLWRRVSADPEAADPGEVELVNAMIQGLLPEVEDAQWQVESVLAAPTSDFHAELISGTRQLLTLELRHRGDVTDAERNSFGQEAFQGYPCSRRSRYLFVLAGNVELRATGEDPAFRSSDSLETVLIRFPLEQLAEL